MYQDLTRLDVEIKERTFFTNPVLTDAVDQAKNSGKAVHIMGLLSAGGVHSHEDHILAMVELAAERGAEKSICTPSSMAVTPHRAALKSRCKNSKKNLPRWAKVALRPSLVVTTQWTATTVGIALKKRMT